MKSHSRQLLHFLESLWWDHLFYYLDLFRVSLDSPVLHKETQQLTGGDAKHAFLQVEMQVHLEQSGESLLQILDEGPCLPRFYHDVVDVGLSVPPELLA